MEPYYDADGITIYHGDCREILPTLGLGGDVVLVTDPPYGIAYASNWPGPFCGRPIAGDDDLELRDWAAALGYPSLIFGTWKRERPAATRAVLVWDKGEASGMGDLSIPWRPNWEEIYVLGNGWSGHRGSSVIRDTSVVPRSGPGNGARRQHPTEKPIPLLRGLIGKAPAGVILDPFMGSGTTLRAAKDLGRRAIGIEIEERYCEIAARRLGQMVLDVEGATA